MQTPDDPTLAAALDAAVNAPVRRPCWRVLVDWNRDGGFDHPYSDLTAAVGDNGIDVERALTSDLPADASLVNGYAGASGTVHLTQPVNGVPPWVLLSPYRLDSPLHGVALVGAPARVEIGLHTSAGPVHLPQITGTLRALDVKSEARSVELTIADPSDTLRAPITLPFGALRYSRSKDDPAAYPFRMRTQWVVDYILRRNGYGAPIHPNAVMSMTCHGSAIAEIGQAVTPFGSINPPVPAGEEWWITGPHGLMAFGGSWVSSPLIPVLHEKFEATAGNGIGIGMWVYHGAGIGSDAAIKALTQCVIGADNSQRVQVIARGDSGALGCSVSGSPFVSVPGSACLEQGWRYLAVHFSFRADGTHVVTTRFQGETVTHAPQTTQVAGPWRAATRTFVAPLMPMSDVQVWHEPVAPAAGWPGESYTGSLDLEEGLNRLTYLPTRTGVDSWELLQEVVAAEFGTVGFDEAGEPFFLQRDSPRLDPGTVERVIDAGRTLRSLDVGLSSDTVRNTAVIETEAHWENQQATQFEATDPAEFESPVGITEYVVQIFPQTLPFGGEQELPRVNSAQWNPDNRTFGYVAVRPDGVTEVTTGIRVIASPSGQNARDIVIRVENTSGGSVRFATTSNEPALLVAGYPIFPYPPAVEMRQRLASIATYGPRALGLDKSDWHQLPDPITGVIDALLNELDEPIPVLPAITTVGDPRTQLGDTAELRDPQGVAASIVAGVVEIRRHVSASEGLVDTYAVRPVIPPAPLGLLDDPELGLLDDTMVLAT